jgi:proteasome lid subunit RPN8/RPN11
VTSRLVLPARFREQLIDHARAERPNECVGLLAGNGHVVERVFPLANEANSPTRYLAAAGLFEPMRAMRAAGLELVGIYHSHPTSPPIPSKRDLEENYYPEAVHVIVSLDEGQQALRAWTLSETPTEIELVG